MTATIKYDVHELRSQAAVHPHGRASQILARGTALGDWLSIDEVINKEIVSRFSEPLPTRFPISKLLDLISLRPSGFVKFILSHGILESGEVVLPTDAHAELERLYDPIFAAESTDFEAQMLRRAIPSTVGNLRRWAREGLWLVSRTERDKRFAVCESCDRWDAVAHKGMGMCKLCGCSSLKLWLRGVHCPDSPSKW